MSEIIDAKNVVTTDGENMTITEKESILNKGKTFVKNHKKVLIGVGVAIIGAVAIGAKFALGSDDDTIIEVETEVEDVIDIEPESVTD